VEEDLMVAVREEEGAGNYTSAEGVSFCGLIQSDTIE